MKQNTKKKKKIIPKYFVYILECSDKTFYIGITNNLEQRIFAHNNLKSGAKYTSGRRPVVLKYSEEIKSRNKNKLKSLALKREFELKKLTRVQKEGLFKK